MLRIVVFVLSVAIGVVMMGGLELVDKGVQRLGDSRAGAEPEGRRENHVSHTSRV